MGDKLTDGSEVLFRQIHPQFFQDGEPASNRFMPSDADQNLLSVDRSSLVTAAQSHAHYTSNGAASAAVFGVSVHEFGKESIECVADPRPAENERLQNTAHALANYSSHSPKHQKNVAKRLKIMAVTRGIQFP